MQTSKEFCSTIHTRISTVGISIARVLYTNILCAAFPLLVLGRVIKTNLTETVVRSREVQGRCKGEVGAKGTKTHCNL